MPDAAVLRPAVRVDKLALKLCDTINWTGMYRMRHAVHLQGVRCDGQAHGGCPGRLPRLLEAWLKRVRGRTRRNRTATASNLAVRLRLGQRGAAPRCTRTELLARAHNHGATAPSGEETYSCQATELIRAAPERIPSWDLRQYVLDVRSGNATTLAMIRSLCVGLFNEFQDLSRKVLPERLRLWGGRRFPFIEGKLKRTPEASLGLEAGELVKVKSKEAIVQTLDVHNKNRGMSFDAEMLKYCGRQARVLRRVEQIIDERSGTMMRFKNPASSLRTSSAPATTIGSARVASILAGDLAGTGGVTRRGSGAPVIMLQRAPAVGDERDANGQPLWREAEPADLGKLEQP